MCNVWIRWAKPQNTAGHDEFDLWEIYVSGRQVDAFVQ